MRAGFPHSDICGSMLVCQLPAAFRRLPRPSSPVIAKASTTCTYSLDPITLSAPRSGCQLSAFSCQYKPAIRYQRPQRRTSPLQGLLQRLVAVTSSLNKATMQSSNPVTSIPFESDRCAFTSSKFLKNSVFSLQLSAFSTQLLVLC